MPYPPTDKIKVPRFEEAAGFYTTERISQIMRRVRVADTTPEVAFRKALWHAGLRYRCHRQVLRYRPDIVLLRWRIAIFIDGDFWHGNPNTKHHHINIDATRQNDILKEKMAAERGYTVVRLWESDIKKDITIVGERLKG